MGIESNCSICAELACRADTRFALALQEHGLFNAVLSHNNSFVIVPSLGPLRVGHYLIVTRDHRSNVLAGSVDLRRLTDLADSISCAARNLIGGNSETLIAFEHGATDVGSTSNLCSTAHAHLHVLPLPGDMSGKVIQQLGSDTNRRSLAELCHATLPYSEYLTAFACDNTGKVNGGIVTSAYNHGSQFLRKVVARVLGNSRWDWHEHANMQDLHHTIARGFRTNVRCCSRESRTPRQRTPLVT